LLVEAGDRSQLDEFGMEGRIHQDEVLTLRRGVCEASTVGEVPADDAAITTVELKTRTKMRARVRNICLPGLMHHL
jgi:hypothetical protein